TAIPVRTLAVRASGTVQSAALSALSIAGPAQAHAAPPVQAARPAPAAPPAQPVTQYQTPSASSTPAPLRPTAARQPPVARPPAPVQTASLSTSQAAAQPAAPARAARGRWIIQIGAFPDESEARERLQSAQSMAKNILGHADAFTE